MARRSVWVQMQREAERRRREAEKAARALEQERQRQAKEAARQRVYDEKERKRLYLEERSAEAEGLSHELGASVARLEGLLTSALALDDAVDFEALKESPTPLPFDPGELAKPLTPPVAEPPAPLGILQKLIPGAKAKHAQAVEEADRRFAETLAQAVQAERDRQTAFAEAQTEHEKKVQVEAERVAAQHSEVDSFRESYEQRNPEALVTYCSLVLAASQYPDAFPQQDKIAYVPESRQLVIEMDLPTFDVIPEQLEYRYVKAKDEIAAKARPAAQRKALYSRVVSQVTLRTVHEMFESDRPQHIESLVFNGHVDTIDPRTGQPTRPCLITLHTTRELFGTMQNEGASKGILVTTSGYGKASFEFADGKPLELLAGSNLLYLLEEHAGITAKIEPPEDWADPMEDVDIDVPRTINPAPASVAEQPSASDDEPK